MTKPAKRAATDRTKPPAAPAPPAGFHDSQKTALPPKPSLSLTALKKRSNSFAEVDKIVSEKLAKYPPSKKLAVYMQKAGTDDPIYYARRCILFAGLQAWQRAREWEQERSTVQAHIAKIAGQIDDLMRANDALKQLAEKVTGREKSYPKVSDPTIIAERVDYFGTFETLLQATSRVEVFAYDDLAEVKRKIEDRNYGRKDVLADQFIGNLAGLWKTLFGEQPPARSEGDFVDLADEAWKAIGWGKRPSLGKKVLRKATDEFWSDLKRMDRHLAGTI